MNYSTITKSQKKLEQEKSEESIWVLLYKGEELRESLISVFLKH